MSSADLQKNINSHLDNPISGNKEDIFIKYIDSLSPECSELLKSFYANLNKDKQKTFKEEIIDNKDLIEEIGVDFVKKIINKYSTEVEEKKADEVKEEIKEKEVITTVEEKKADEVKEEKKEEVKKADEVKEEKKEEVKKADEVKEEIKEKEVITTVEEKKADEVKEEIKEKEVITTVEEKKADEVKEEKKEEEKKLTEAKKRIEKIYSFFGGKKGLERKLTEKGVNVETERKKAEQIVLKDNPKIDVNSDEFKSRVDILFIASNKKTIATIVPEEKKKEFETLYRDIQDSAHKLKIDCASTVDYNDKPNFGIFGKDTILMDDRRKIAVSIPDGTDITRKGGIISYERDGRKYEINIDERPPERFIETDGIKVKVDSKNISEGSPYELVAKKRQLEGEIKGIKKYLEEKKSGIEQKILNLNAREEELKKKERKFESGVFESDGMSELYSKDDLKKLAQKGIEEDREKIIQDKQEVRIYKEQEALLKLKEQELLDITQKEQNLIPNYRRSLREREEIARGNLDFLAKAHINVFGQENINRVVELINKHRVLNENAGARPVDINEGFINSDKSVIINGMTKLLGGVKYFKSPTEIIDYIDGQQVDNRFIKEKLKQTGVLQKDGVTVNLDKIEALLKSDKNSQTKTEEKSK